MGGLQGKKLEILLIFAKRCGYGVFFQIDSASAFLVLSLQEAEKRLKN
jgi:hypothetical protein